MGPILGLKFDPMELSLFGGEGPILRGGGRLAVHHIRAAGGIVWINKWIRRTVVCLH